LSLQLQCKRADSQTPLTNWDRWHRKILLDRMTGMEGLGNEPGRELRTVEGKSTQDPVLANWALGVRRISPRVEPISNIMHAHHLSP
jgi:hypothetical protein